MITVKVRMEDRYHKEVLEDVIKYPELYDNLSHFIRVAVIRELKRKKEDST